MNFKIFRTVFPRLLILLALIGCVPAAAPNPTQSSAQDVILAKSDLARDDSPQVDAGELDLQVRGNNSFALDLYRTLRKNGDNLIFSPYSISTALAMTYAGAMGETEQQMAETLHYRLPQEDLHPAFNALDLRQNRPSEDEASFTLQVANSLWGQKDFPFRREFMDRIAENYGAGMRLVDFIGEENREEARQAINNWVADETQDRIQDLIEEGVLSEDTRLVLANAIYFKGEWTQPFLNGTSKAPFTLLDGSQVDVDMMSRRSTTGYMSGNGFQAFGLDYKGERARMLIILPDSGSFEAVEESLTPEALAETAATLQPDDLRLFLPKFEFESELALADTLLAMGMPDAFDQNKANFNGMYVREEAGGNLFIKHVIHKANITVDEIGTEAAAATGVVVEIESLPLEVRVDRPFLFAIQDVESGSILFFGRVMNPSE